MPSLSSPPSRPAAGASPALDRGAWHRRASRPVLMWMVALIVTVLVHRWLPQSRWLLVHMVTLGLITTSIMVWGQHFTEALLKTRLGEQSRRRQLARIYLLTAGIVVTIAGILPSWPWLVVVGALMVSAALVWYAAALGAQVKAALAPRFEFTVKAYIAASCLLPVGATLGAVMAFSPGEPWQGRLLLAHQILNVLGFVGLTVTGTLLTLWPTVLRTRIELDAARRAAQGLQGMFLAVLGATAGALVGSALLGAVFVVIYLGCLAWVGATLVRLAVRAARQERTVPLSLFPVLSIGAGVIWCALTVGALAVLWWGSADAQLSSSLVAADAQRLTVPFVAGFMLQVLFGAMSHLLPVTLRGGPRSTKAALEMMSRGAVVRVVAYNLAVALFVLGEAGGSGAAALFSALTLGTADAADFGSMTRVLVSLLAFAVLVSFVVLLVLAVRVSIRLRGEALPTPTVPPSRPATGDGAAPSGPTSRADSSPARLRARAAAQERSLDRRSLTGVLLGVGAVLATTAAGTSLDRFRGSVPAEDGRGGSGGITPTGETTTVAVSMAELRLTPDVLEVPFVFQDHCPGFPIHAPEDLALIPASGSVRDSMLSMVRALAAVHAVDIDAVGLGDLRRPGGFVERQLRRWLGQFEAITTRDLPVIGQVQAQLSRSIPPETSTGLVHGDVKPNNMLFDRDTGEVRAIVDWELSSIGDVVTDLGYLLSMMFVDDSLTGIWTPSVEDGSPTAEEITQTYASLTGRDTSDVPYYAAFAVWKLACIREGVYTRLKQGRMGDLDVDPEQAGASVEALAASALDILRSGRI